MTIQTYGWTDLIMGVTGAASGGGTPTQTVFGPSANIKQTAFTIGDSVYISGHFTHDMLQKSTAYLHVHWATDGTDVNTVKWECRYTIADGYDTEAFPAETVLTLEEAGPGTAWQHMITEDGVGFTVPDIDALILLELKRVTNGGTDNTDTVFGLFVDIHYQVGQVATPSRSPNFWA